MCHGQVPRSEGVQEVELWTDEAEAKCGNCGNVVSRAMLQGCVDYCEGAKECLGEELYNRLMAAKQHRAESRKPE